jgi:hypothetical protein
MGVNGQRHAPAALYTREKDPGSHCTGGWVGLRAVLDTEARGKISSLCRASNPSRPSTVYKRTILKAHARIFNTGVSPVLEEHCRGIQHNQRPTTTKQLSESRLQWLNLRVRRPPATRVCLLLLIRTAQKVSLQTSFTSDYFCPPTPSNAHSQSCR